MSDWGFQVGGSIGEHCVLSGFDFDEFALPGVQDVVDDNQYSDLLCGGCLSYHSRNALCSTASI